jgi:carboxylesterase
LKLAVEWRWGIRALACISTPLKLATFVRVAFPLVWHTPIKHIYKFQAKDYMTSVADPDGRERYKTMSYDRMPLRSVAEIRLLQDVLKRELPTMATPLLMVHAKRDTVAPISNVDETKKLVKSSAVEKLILERSHHVVTLDYEKDLVAERIIDFFDRFQ